MIEDAAGGKNLTSIRITPTRVAAPN